MNKSRARAATRLRRAEETISPNLPTDAPVPRIVRYGWPGTQFGWRHVKGVAVTRWLVALWLVVLGTIFCVTGHWWGVFLYATAALVGWLAHQMPRWKLTLDALQNGPRVRELERSRALVVDDSAARLRRIEQDLHDGAQAQLVAVVMKLGLVREHLQGLQSFDGLKGLNSTTHGPGDLERALEALDDAQQRAMHAIGDLRDLARGIHPPALGEGLRPALAALAARSDVRVELIVDVTQRPSPAIEVIAYFCAAELLANVAKHSGAHQATIEVTDRRDSIRLIVSDHGRGGARIEDGGGLAGLAERARTVDGRLQVSSPVGGPTVVDVELPSHA